MNRLKHPGKIKYFLLLFHASNFLFHVGDCASMQPAFTLPLANLTVQIGKNATFTCYVRSIQSYKVAWVKADTKAIQAIGDHVITSNTRVSVSQEKTQKHHFHITNVELDDAGPYMCQINTDPMKYQLGSLNVIVPTDITGISGMDGVREGDRVKLVCQIKGFPRPKVFWTRMNRTQPIVIREGRNGVRKEMSIVKGNVLEFPKIRRSQMGKYLCIADNGHPPVVSRVADLKVYFRPVISVSNPVIDVKLGADVSMECNIEAYQKGVNYWETNQGGIATSNSKYVVHEYYINDYSLKTILTVNNFTMKDVGVYQCICKNAMSPMDGVRGQVTLNLYTTTYTDPDDEYFYSNYDSFHYESGRNRHAQKEKNQLNSQGVWINLDDLSPEDELITDGSKYSVGPTMDTTAISVYRSNTVRPSYYERNFEKKSFKNKKNGLKRQKNSRNVAINVTSKVNSVFALFMLIAFLLQIPQIL